MQSVPAAAFRYFIERAAIFFHFFYFVCNLVGSFLWQEQEKPPRKKGALCAVGEESSGRARDTYPGAEMQSKAAGTVIRRRMTGLNWTMMVLPVLVVLMQFALGRYRPSRLVTRGREAQGKLRCTSDFPSAFFPN